MAYSEDEKQKVFDDICSRIEAGESLRSVLRSENMPSSQTFYKWIDEDENKSKQYARATTLRAEIIFDEMLEISDTPIEGVVVETDDNGRIKEKKGDMLGHRRLQIDTRKWILARMNPKKYSDKLDLSSIDGSMTPKASNDLSKVSIETLLQLKKEMKSNGDQS